MGMDLNELRGKLRLYYIADGETHQQSPLVRLRAILEAGCRAVQLRMKPPYAAQEILPIARDFSTLCRQYGALFFVNDSVEIALASGAAGVHLGQSDLNVAQARLQVPLFFIIGASAKTEELARRAEGWGADYIGSGAAFATKTKQDTTVIGPEGIRHVVDACSCPCVAIGGITEPNISLLEGTGIAGVAVGHALNDAADPYDTAQKILFTLSQRRC